MLGFVIKMYTLGLSIRSITERKRPSFHFLAGSVKGNSMGCAIVGVFMLLACVMLLSVSVSQDVLFLLQVSRNSLEFGQLKNALVNTNFPLNKGGFGGGGEFISLLLFVNLLVFLDVKKICF